MSVLRPATIVLCVLLAAACGPEEPAEARIRKAIETMAGALEQGKPDPFLERVAGDFTGGGGGWDRQRVRQYVLGRTLHSRAEPQIDIKDVRIELFDGRAKARVEVVFSGEGQWLPGRGARYRFDTGWRLDDETWRIINARWERLDR